MPAFPWRSVDINTNVSKQSVTNVSMQAVRLSFQRFIYSNLDSTLRNYIVSLNGHDVVEGILGVNY